MSLEKNPTASSVEETPGKKGANKKESFFLPFPPEIKSRFNQLPEKAKKVVEYLYQNFGGETIVGKLKIAYNQFWIDKHQEKARKLAGKFDAYNLQIKKLEEAKEKFESYIKKLEEKGFVSIQLNLNKQIELNRFEKSINDLRNKRDKVQSKLEDIDNKIKLYTNKRNRIVDNFIQRYEEKRKPLEDKLEDLKKEEAEVNMTIIVYKEYYENIVDELNDLRKEQNTLKSLLEKKDLKKIITTTERRSLKKSLNNFEKQLKENLKIALKEKEFYIRKKEKIEKKIAKVDAKANHYRDKREKFARIITESIEIPLPEREKRKIPKKREEITTHERKEKIATKREAPSVEIKTEEKERRIEERGRILLSKLVEYWNEFVKDKEKDLSIENLSVNQEEFEALKALILKTEIIVKFEEFRVSLEGFKEIISNFLTLAKKITKGITSKKQWIKIMKEFETFLREKDIGKPEEGKKEKGKEEFKFKMFVYPERKVLDKPEKGTKEEGKKEGEIEASKEPEVEKESSGLTEEEEKTTSREEVKEEKEEEKEKEEEGEEGEEGGK